MLNDIKKMRTAFEHLGMKVNTDHTQCPSPEHEGKTTVSCHEQPDGTILWTCHRCGENGSIIDAYIVAYGIDQKDAIDKLKKEYGGQIPDEIKRMPSTGKVFKKDEEVKPTYQPIPPAPDGSWVHRIDGQPRRVSFDDATFLDLAPCEIDGELTVAAAVRWDIGNEKIMRQMHWRDGEWERKAPPSNRRPIYKMKEIDSASNDTIIMIVEGEKCMHALQDACNEARKTYESFPDVIVTTNLGGSKAAKKAVWDVIGMRHAYILRDNDEPGIEWANLLYKRIDRSVVLDIAKPASPKSYDVYDWLEEGEDVRSLFRMTPVEMEQKKESNILKDAMEIAEDIDPKEVSSFLKRVIAQEPDPIFLDLLLQKLKDATGISMGALRQAIKEHREELAVDWPLIISNQVVADIFKGHLILSHEMFWGYTGTHWKKYSDKVMQNYILALSQRVIPPSEFDSESITKKGLTVIKALVATDDDVLNLRGVPKSIINCKNGEVHINSKTGEYELKPHDPKSYMTHCLDIHYDPTAKCEEYDLAVDQIFCGRKDLVRHYHEVGGYIIQPKRKFKNFFMAYGRKGNNGKTSLFTTLVNIIGSQQVAPVEIDSFGKSRHDTSNLVGKIMVLDDDVKKNTFLNDGLIKQLSEQKLINVEYKRKDHFQMVSSAAVVMLCNHWPATSDLTDAMISRAMVLPFDAQFKGKNSDRYLFERIIRNELPGVLNHLLTGLKRLLERDAWDVPEACEIAKKEWLGETSTLYSFFMEMMEESTDSVIYSKELRTAYENWCEEEGVKDKYMVQTRKLKSSVQDLGVTVSKRTNNNYGKWKVVGYKLAGSD